MDKLLKSPNSPHIVCAALIVEVLVASGEVLEPRVVSTVLRGTPILVTSETANCGFLQVYLVEFVFRWQKPVAVSVQHKIITYTGCNA